MPSKSLGTRNQDEAFLTFRALKRADAMLLGRMFEQNANPATTRYFHPFPLSQQSADELSSRSGRDRYYVAARPGAIIALSMLRGWDEGYIIPSFGMLVDRDSQRQGVGSRLLTFTMSEARRLGASHVRLSVYESHASALGLYIRQGFVEQARVKVETAFGADFVIIMRKSIRG